MKRRLGVALLALLAAGCPGQTVIEEMPTSPASPEPTPPPATLAPTPPPATPTPTPAPQSTPPPPCDPPTVSISRPSDGQTLRTSPQTINTNAGHSVVRVEFYYHIDRRSIASVRDPAVLIGNKNAPPFRIEWRLPRECTASASLLAIAFNACGDAAASDFVRIDICF